MLGRGNYISFQDNVKIHVFPFLKVLGRNFVKMFPDISEIVNIALYITNKTMGMDKLYLAISASYLKGNESIGKTTCSLTFISLFITSHVEYINQSQV